LRKAGATEAALEDFRWQIEELRVSLFAQELKTPYPVSVKRLKKAWDALSR
jgi:ATP-dependent helicase HrpA